SVVEFEAYALQNTDTIQKSLTCQKTRRIIEDRFYFPFNAHNVLTYYPSTLDNVNEELAEKV
ncbi:MAG TPA: hypothetical protein VMR41_06365, partial [Patescibacteria group bacterium]|nr:hypothetical protein [Patescibacteria group bacterium]